MSRRKNRLLESLPAVYRNALLASMDEVALPVSHRIFEQTTDPEYAHFVTSGAVSIVDFMENGDGVEVRLVGCEGMVEATHLLGRARTPTRAFVQVEGSALRCSFADLREQFLTYEPLRSAILSYVQIQAFTVDQLAACNRLHEVEQRIARWLLTMLDRVGDHCFPLTQEFLAEMMGTRRTTVTLAARRLQMEGCIEYSRGKMRIVNRRALEGFACECYSIIQALNTHTPNASLRRRH